MIRTPAITRHTRRGVGLVELLIALAIAAALLTATAVAVDASFRAYRINQEQSSLIQSARLALHRITTSIRGSKEHAPDDSTAATQFAGGQIVTASGIAMFDNNGAEVIYRHDSVNQRLLVIANGQQHVLADGVTSFQVKCEPMRSAASIKSGGSWDLLLRATITLSLRTTSRTAADSETTGEQTLTLSASAMPRRNCW